MGVKKYTVKGKPQWMADFWIDLPDGRKRRIIKRRIPTREMAEALERKAKTESFEGSVFETRKKVKITVADCWEAYEPITRRDNDSWQSDTGRAAVVCRLLGSVQVESLSLKHVDKYRAIRAGEKTVRGGAPTAATVNREISLLKRMLNYSIQTGDLKFNPIGHVRALAEHNIRNSVITEEVFRKLAAAADSRIRGILILAFDCGMRKREILDLRWEQVDLQDGIISLAAEDTKTDSPDIVILSSRSIAELKALPRAISGWVFPNPETGKPWVDIRKMFTQACKKAGLATGLEGGIIFHDLRRSFVTNSRKAGIPESVVMEMSRHKTREVFARYNIVDTGDRRRAMVELDENRHGKVLETKSR